MVRLSNIHRGVSLPLPSGLCFLRILLDLQILNENSVISLVHMTTQVNKLVRDVCLVFFKVSLFFFPVDTYLKSN